MVIMQVLVPNLTPRGRIMVRMVSGGMVGMVSHFTDVIGACICSNVDLHVCVYGSTQCGCVVNGSVAIYGSWLSIDISEVTIVSFTVP